MKFRGPKALGNRRQKTIVCPTSHRLTSDFRSSCPLGAEVLLDPRLSPVNGPAQRRALIDRVFDFQSRSPLDQQSDNRIMSGQNGLMQRGRVGMVPVGIVSAWVFAGIKEQPNDLHVSMLRGERERTVPALGIGRCEQLLRIAKPP